MRSEQIVMARQRLLILAANPWLKSWGECWRDGTTRDGRVGEASERRVTFWMDGATRPGRGYSWPGSCSDRTFWGVYFHEVGHVIHFQLGDDISRDLVKLREPRVSSYEPHRYEAFAETCRLYLGNPALLRAGRPRRYALLREAGILPPAWRSRDWRRGLCVLSTSSASQAPQRFIDQCERWIARGK